MRAIEADQNRSSDTHLHRFPLPEHWGIDLYLKDESVHPTGSLKHRLARSLVLYGLVNGDIRQDTTLVESSSGSTAVSVAWFAQLIGVDFVAVMPRGTSRAKLDLIEKYGGRCHIVGAGDLYDEAERLGARSGWFYLDQFSRASVVTDWRGNNNIAGAIFDQMSHEPHPVPTWIVVAAGTGGTSATIGRYVRYIGADTQLAVVDPEGSAFTRGWREGDTSVTAPGSRIEGIGRPRVEPSFVPGVIDEMIEVADGDSIAAARWLAARSHICPGASTGTNLIGAFDVISRMRAADQRGSVVTLVCDSGLRYGDTYFSDAWVSDQGIDLIEPTRRLDDFLRTGVWRHPRPTAQDPAVSTPDPWSLLREDLRRHTADVDAVVMRPADDRGLSRADRLRIALRVADVNEDAALRAIYAAELEAEAPGAVAVVEDPQQWTTLPPRTAALLAHCEQVALDPADSGESEMTALLAAGVPAQVAVAAAQVVCYVSYRSRLLRGLTCLAHSPAQPTGRRPEAVAPSREAVPQGTAAFPVLKWRPWVPAPAEPDREAGADAKTPKKWTPFYRTLLHDPEVLAERTALYDAIMTGEGALDRAERELVALATSLVTGCRYCASVHGRRHVQLSKDQASAAALAAFGPEVLTDVRARVLVGVAAKLAPTPATLDADDIAALRGIGLDDASVADMMAVSAMFAWANRLMMTLGAAEES
ncbi:pyridoxal-phosphate dependent enzyme [Streptomyces sp. NBRC 110028]|uniref:pyridoxal-phosphate dependent enzyme n=1 Tax=Streptomyces sp. NBRC 110028 TaxID=1621260 RepID=UPI0007C65741|nr:pyridoxal-phosphate dependent enzyme [Streptomyces sp. NBRC 110028]